MGHDFAPHLPPARMPDLPIAPPICGVHCGIASRAVAKGIRLGEILAAFGGGMAALFAAWRMVAYYDKTNREEHAALLKAIQAVDTRVSGVETRLGERIAAIEGKLDVLIGMQRPS